MVTRRSFLGLCLVGSCGVGLGAADDAQAAAGARPDAVRELGRRYLSLHPEESDRRRLIELLEQAVPEHAGMDGVGPLLRDEAALRRAFRRDYACGNCMYVEGWLFARTELRLCAFAAVS